MQICQVHLFELMDSWIRQPMENLGLRGITSDCRFNKHKRWKLMERSARLNPPFGITSLCDPFLRDFNFRAGHRLIESVSKFSKSLHRLQNQGKVEGICIIVGYRQVDKLAELLRNLLEFNFTASVRRLDSSNFTAAARECGSNGNYGTPGDLIYILEL